MAVTREEYFDAIGRAGLVWSDKVLVNISKEKQGCFPSWVAVFCELKKIEIAEYFYRLEDYAESSDSALFYSSMLSIAGTQYSDAEVDPNAQVGGIVINPTYIGRAVKVVYNAGSSNLTKDELNELYVYPEYQEGDIVYLPNAFLQYTKLENTVDSDWAQNPLDIAG